MTKAGVQMKRRHDFAIKRNRESKIRSFVIGDIFKGRCLSRYLHAFGNAALISTVFRFLQQILRIRQKYPVVKRNIKEYPDKFSTHLNISYTDKLANSLLQILTLKIVELHMSPACTLLMQESQ